MSASQDVQVEPAIVTASRLALEAVRSAEATRTAIYNAMAWAGQNGVAIPGWPVLQESDAYLQRLVDPHGTVRALAENEVRAYEGTTS